METVFPAKAQRVASASNASRFIPFLATDRICDFHGEDPQDVTSFFSETHQIFGGFDPITAFNWEFVFTGKEVNDVKKSMII